MSRRAILSVMVDLNEPELARISVIGATVQGTSVPSVVESVIAAANRLLKNADVDLDECTCAEGDVCPACALKNALATGPKKKRRST